MHDPNQIEMATLNQWVPRDHPYRKILNLIDLQRMCEPITDLDNTGRGANGFGIVTLFQCLLLQFMEDLSDRELQRYLHENVAAKFFCGLGLMDATPDYSLFSKARRRIGTQRLSGLFSTLRDQLQAKGWASEVFTFIDATHLISKAKLCQERNKAKPFKPATKSSTTNRYRRGLRARTLGSVARAKTSSGTAISSTRAWICKAV